MSGEEDFIEEEAEEESVDDGSSDESDDEEEGGNDSLIDDNLEDDEERSPQTKKRGKRHARIDDRLEDDDFELIRENTGIEVPKNKYRRIQMFDSDEEDEPQSKETPLLGQKGQSADRQRHASPIEEVFGASDDDEDSTLDTSGMRDPFLDDDEETESPEKGSRHEKQYGVDELDDFIDDGMPVSSSKSGVYTEPALLEALDVFGEFNPTEFGIGSEEEEDEEDDDQSADDEDEYGSRPHKVKKKAKKTIYDVYEPSELERGHFTEADAIIRITDVPERFQLRSIPVQNTEEGELEREADWVYHQAFCNPPISRQPQYGSKYGQRAGVSANVKPQSAIPKIKEALNLLRNHFFEVPYITTYRQEYVEPELDQSDLWKILKWDERWMELQQRKQSLRKLFVRMQQWQFEKVREEPDKALTEDYRSLEDEDLQRLDAVQTEDELSDVYQHFMLYYGRDVIAMKNKKVSQMNEGPPLLEEDEEEKEKEKSAVKHARRRDFYSICQEAGLGSLASKFGLTAEQFGENLRDNYQRHETEQHPTEPEEAAQEFIQPSGFFTSVRSILQGACHMVAMQIAYEPLVRQALRQVFSTRAVVNVMPTKKGKKVIDENHPCYSCKYLKNKPVREFRGDEFLRLVQAEKDGLLNIKISIDIEHSSDSKRNQGSSAQPSTYFEEIRMLFYRDEFSMVVEKWNAQRAQAVAHALLKVLYPQMEKEIKTKLIQEAKEYVIESCAHQFRKWLNTGPCDFNRGVGDSEDGPRVMACAYSDDLNTAGYCCFLDGNGDFTDYLKLSCIHIRRNSYSEVERTQKEEELHRISSVIKKRKPDIIVVSAESRNAFGVVDDIRSCLSEIEFKAGSTPPPVELIDPNVARIFCKSYRSKEMFPNYPELLCQAVSLARRAHEPLTEFTSLFLAQEDEVLALRMHVLQSAVQQDQLKQTLEAELVTKVNEVGVDINYCMEHSHAESLIPFVSGFGPRKASALLKTLRQESIQIQNRSQLVTQCSIGPQVFINCAGFIKINTAAFDLSDTSSVEVLDSTRIHPETYAWATKMAVDALEYEDYNPQESDAAPPVEEIMRKPDKLHDLDLDAFAVELQRRGCGNKRTTLYNIRDELFVPFKDHRAFFTTMSSEDKFTLLTGETPESFHEGRLVTCTVTGIARRRPNQMARERANPIKDQVTGIWQCPFCLQPTFHDVSMVWSHIDDGSCPGQGIGVRTKLENGLSGFVLTKNLSDRQVTSPEERVKVGMTIHCRILSVNIEKFSVDLSCRSSDLADKQGRFSVQKDMYYNHSAADADRKREESLHHRPKQRFMKRVIVHPSFHNVTFSEADKLLASTDQGEGIFRPSSQGNDRLTLTWKVTDKILQHVDIKEEGKPNPYSLGKSLVIGEEEYEDLDEILARYMQPMAANARDILAHKSYREAHGGDKKYLERYLNEEKTKNPKRIPYFFSASSQFPGKFILAYQPGMRPRLEFVTITPEGFRYRGQVHGSVTQLINWFKEHFKDPIRVPKPHPSQQLRPGSVHGSSAHGSSGTPYIGRSYQSGQTPYTPSQWMFHTPSSVTGSTNPHWSYRPTPPRDNN